MVQSASDGIHLKSTQPASSSVFVASNSGARAVIFDMDGVLVLTEQLKGRAHSAVTRELGSEVPASLYESLMGQSHESVQCAFMKAGHVTADPACYTAKFRQIYDRMLKSELQVAPGVLVLLGRLEKQGYLLGVVTSSSTSVAERVLADAGLLRFFSAVVTADDVARPKPAPDCYKIVLEHLRVRPDNAVAFEDSDAGVNAAVAAGVRVVAVRHTMNSRHRFGLAEQTVNSLSDTQGVVATLEGIFEAACPGPAYADDRAHH